MFSDCIIMAGGSGTRLWPASNSKTPKQFLSIPGGSSFFASALERAFAVMAPEGRLVVVAGESHAEHVVRACADLEKDQRERVVVISEPRARNTAPAVACAAVYLRRALGPGRTALVLTSDHIIGPLAAFAADATAAAALARENRLAVFGIPPSRPETGYGYIEAAAAIDAYRAAGSERCYEAASFREKPDASTAERFLAAGNFFWNSGMFGFSVDFMLEEFRRSSPATLEPFETLEAPGTDETELREGVRLVSRWKGLPAAYEAVAGISIDYAVAEKCPRVALVAASFDWLDVGSWDEYARFMKEDRGTVYAADASGCYVDSDLPVALCGVEDLIVVVRSGADGKPPAVLVCKKGESQGVKEIVEAVKRSGRTDLL